MKKLFFFIGFLSISMLSAQFVEAGLKKKDYSAWRKDTTYVVLSQSDTAYNSAMKKYLDAEWEFNAIKYIPEDSINNEYYRDAHENDMELHVVALSGSIPMANNSKSPSTVPLY